MQYKIRSEYGIGSDKILEAIESRPDGEHSLANYRHAISEISYQIRLAESQILLDRRDKLRERYKGRLDAHSVARSL